MKRAPKVYSGTIDATKAAAFYDRLHVLKDALEALQSQYAEDMTAVFAEASEALNADPAILRMAFTEERQKRKREARIAKMDAGKARQLDLLSDVAAGSEALGDGGTVLAPTSAMGKPADNSVTAMNDPRYGRAIVASVDLTIPACLDRRTKPPPQPVA